MWLQPAFIHICRTPFVEAGSAIIRSWSSLRSQRTNIPALNDSIVCEPHEQSVQAPGDTAFHDDCVLEQGLPTRDQEAHATFSGRLLTCGGRAFEQSKRVRVVSMATRMRSSRSATGRRARP